MKTEWSATEEKYLRRLKKVFHQDYPTGTLGIVECDHKATREVVYKRIQAELPELKHHRLDASSDQVESLQIYLQDKVSEAVSKSEPVTYVVHVFGLENSLYKVVSGEMVKSKVIAQINMERETLWRFPFHILLWVDPFLVKKFQYDAVDFWSWITHFYRFSGPQQAYLPEAKVFQAMTQEELNYPEIDKRIVTYEKFLADLEQQHDGQWNDRSRMSKINALLLLGDAYGLRGLFEKAEALLRLAECVYQQLKQQDPYLLFEMNRLLVVSLNQQGDFETALALAQDLLAFALEADDQAKVFEMKLLNAQLLAHLKRDDQATVLLDQVINQIDDEQAEVNLPQLIMVLYALAQAGKFVELLAFAEKHRDAFSQGTTQQQWAFHDILARTFLQMGQAQKAFDLMEDFYQQHHDSLGVTPRFFLQVVLLDALVALKDTERYLEHLDRYLADQKAQEAHEHVFDLLGHVLQKGKAFLESKLHKQYFQMALEYVVEHQCLHYLEKLLVALTEPMLKQPLNPVLREAVQACVRLLKQSGKEETAARLAKQLAELKLSADSTTDSD